VREVPAAHASIYPGDELDAMTGARNYFEWIIALWRPYLRGRVLELGAGIGNFSGYLLNERIDELVLIEPAKNLFHRLSDRFSRDPRVVLKSGTLEQALPELLGSPLHVVVSVNVLEHIPDDVAVLRGLRRALRPDGTALILVPALPVLYGSADRNFGHVRRYTKAGLASALRAAGLTPQSIHYLNFLGAFAWFAAGRILRRRTLTTRMVKLSDRTLIPLTRHLEQLVSPPFGQSLVAVARP
jgi:SAM-dependent methyltransferase